MTAAPGYAREDPSREALDALPGAVLLAFGTDWGGHCRASAPIIEKALAAHPAVKHLKVEDGSGRGAGTRGDGPRGAGRVRPKAQVRGGGPGP